MSRSGTLFCPAFRAATATTATITKKLHHQLQQWWEHWMHVELSERDLGRSPPGGVTMTITQYGYSSQYFNFTFTVSSSETMNSLTVTNGSTSICSGTAPSGQGTYASANTPTKISNGLSDNGCSSATFQSGTTYSWTFGDTNGHSFSG